MALSDFFKDAKNRLDAYLNEDGPAEDPGRRAALEKGGKTGLVLAAAVFFPQVFPKTTYGAERQEASLHMPEGRKSETPDFVQEDRNYSEDEAKEISKRGKGEIVFWYSQDMKLDVRLEKESLELEGYKNLHMLPGDLRDEKTNEPLSGAYLCFKGKRIPKLYNERDIAGSKIGLHASRIYDRYVGKPKKTDPEMVSQLELSR